MRSDPNDEMGPLFLPTNLFLGFVEGDVILHVEDSPVHMLFLRLVPDLPAVLLKEEIICYLIVTMAMFEKIRGIHDLPVVLLEDKVHWLFL